jgi:hypothetical protein
MGEARLPHRRAPVASETALTYAETRTLVEETLVALCGRLQVVAPDPRSGGPGPAWPYTQAHTHSHPQVAVCLDGSCVLEIEGQAATLSPYRAAVVAASAVHNERCADPASPYTLLWTSPQAGTAVMWLSRYCPEATVPFVVQAEVRLHGVDVGLIFQAASEVVARLEGWEDAATDYLRAFYRMASRRVWHTRSRVPAFLAEAVRFINDHYHEALTLRRVALQVGVKPRQLRRAFSRHLSISPTRLITATRMAVAAYLLGASWLSRPALFLAPMLALAWLTALRAPDSVTGFQPASGAVL